MSPALLLGNYDRASILLSGPNPIEGTLYAKGIPSAAAEARRPLRRDLGPSNDEVPSRSPRQALTSFEGSREDPRCVAFEQMAGPHGHHADRCRRHQRVSMVKGEADLADVAIIMFVAIVNLVLGVVQEASMRRPSRPCRR